MPCGPWTASDDVTKVYRGACRAVANFGDRRGRPQSLASGQAPQARNLGLATAPPPAGSTVCGRRISSKDKMTPPPLLPIPPRRLSRRATWGWLAAGLASAACLAGFAWRQGAASPFPARQPVALSSLATEDAFPFEAFALEWPEDLAGAVGMFQCWAPAAAEADTSVVVWTDQVNQVVAFGPAMDGVRLPAYAAALAGAPAAGANPPIQVAAPGHVLQVSSKETTLQLQDTKLDCVRNWDD